MIRHRPYRNGDSPALADLWNRCLAARPTTRPLSSHEFDALIPGKLGFDREGLIVAELDDRLVGYVHAGFGPIDPHGPSRAMDTSLGAILVLVIDESLAGLGEAKALFHEAETYLEKRGAQVLYAGGQYPLNPFYWGLYGGSEYSGILGNDALFLDVIRAAGYQAVGESIVLESSLAGPEPRDTRSALVRRHHRVEIEADVLFPAWWDSLCLGLFRPTRLRLVDRITEQAHATLWTWECITELQPDQRRMTTGLVNLEVDPTHRRRGFARYLIQEAWKNAQKQLCDVLSVQTSITNLPALGLYHSMGFTEVGRSTLFRRPGSSAKESEEATGLAPTDSFD